MRAAMFRPLNAAETTLIERLVKKGKIRKRDVRGKKQFLIHYQKQAAGFTVCLVVLPDGSVWPGSSRRSFKDHDKVITGELVALRRALLHGWSVVLPEGRDEPALEALTGTQKANETLGAEGRSARSRKAAATRRDRIAALKRVKTTARTEEEVLLLVAEASKRLDSFSSDGAVAQ